MDPAQELLPPNTQTSNMEPQPLWNSTPERKPNWRSAWKIITLQVREISMKFRIKLLPLHDLCHWYHAGLKTALALNHKPSDKYVTLTTEYKHEHGTVTAQVDYGKSAGILLEGSASVGGQVRRYSSTIVFEFSSYWVYFELEWIWVQFWSKIIPILRKLFTWNSNFWILKTVVILLS